MYLRVSATEVDHNGRETEVDLSTGTTRGQHINTGFDDQSILPRANSKSDPTTLLQDVISKITLMPVAFDRILQQSFASSDKLRPDYSSESYVAPLDPSTSQEHTKDVMGTETGKGTSPRKRRQAIDILVRSGLLLLVVSMRRRDILYLRPLLMMISKLCQESWQKWPVLKLVRR